jgi:hypothetical protein
MEVITKKPIIVEHVGYSSIDGASTKEEILAVQKLINSKGEKLVDETGVFDAKTAEVYNKYKTRIDRELSEMGIEPIKLAIKPIISSNDSTYVPTFVKKDLNLKKSSWWSKRTTKQKGLVIGGLVLVVSVTAFLIYRKVKK